MLIQFGDPIYLNLQLFDGDTGKYPQAILRNQDGTLLTTRDLAHTGQGLYQDSGYNMPNSDIVTAVYKVYNDSAHTILSTDHSDSLDVYGIDTNTARIENIENTINALGAAGISSNLKATISDNNELVAYIKEDETLIGYVGEENLTVTTSDDEILTGTVDDSNLEGIL